MLTNLIFKSQKSYLKLFERKNLNNILWLFIDKVLRLLINLIILGKIAEYLKIGKFGELNLAMALASLFLPIASLGLDNITIKKIIEYPKKENILLATTFYLKLFASILSFILCCVAAYFISNNSPELLITFLIVSATILFSPLDIFDIYFQSKVKSKISALSRLFVFFISSILKILFILNHLTLIYFVWLTLVEIIANFILIGFFFLKKKDIKILKIKNFNIYEAKKMVQLSWTLMISAFSIAIYMRVDQIFLGSISNNEVGYYSAAIRLSEIWNVIPVIICTTIYPSLVLLKKESELEYSKNLKLIYSILIITAITICLFSTFFGELIILFIYGDSYFPSIKIFNIYIWSSVFVFIGVLNNYILLLENQTKSILISTILGSIINIMLNIWLIPIKGAQGAAISTLISYFITVFIVFIFPRYNYLFFKKLFISNIN